MSVYRNKARYTDRIRAQLASGSMDRKSFLKLSALAGSGILLGLNGQRTLRAETPRKILVIGAGIAGLAAASRLTAAGHQVTVLEGRNRIGGRIHTSKAVGAPIDMGAAWIHGSEGGRHPIVKLAKQAGAASVETDFDAMQLFTQRGKAGPTQIDTDSDALEDGYDDVLYALKKQRNRLQNKRKDRSMGQYLSKLIADTDLDATQQRALAWFFNTEFGVELAADLDGLSLRYLDEDLAFGEDESILPNGYGELTDYLARDLGTGNIKLGQNVRRIALKGNGVLVQTNRQAFEADRVICTLPLGVLKQNRVSFAPGLSEKKQQAIQSLGFGALEKVVLRFPKQFWPDDVFQFGYANAPGQKLLTHEIYNYRPYTNQPILVGLAGGEQARMLQKNKRAAVADMLAVLREIFGSKIPAPNKTLTTNWVSDPFALGAYTHVAVGASLGQCRVLAEPIEDRIYFAGEHTSAKYPGTTHGAYLSGLAAVKALAAEL